MSRYLSFASVLLFLLIISCQKEKSFEQGKPSKGSLQDSLGNCLSEDIVGLYKAGLTLSDSNYIDVTVAVTQPGSYVISTDTVNGYYFRSTGNFASAGNTVVRLKGFGTPLSAGNDDFTISYDNSFCPVTISVMTSGSSSGGTAVLSLSGSGGNCMNYNLMGTYTQSVVLNTSNKVQIEVNVTSPGTWIMGTNTVDGFSFYGSGTFASTGVQTITLDGVGTPGAAGSQTFLVTAGSSSCSFLVTVGTTGVPSTDHFILTDNSWWSYGTPIPGDTVKRIIIPGSFTSNGITYKGMKEFDALGQAFDDTLFFRKSGNNYYEFNYIDYYTSFYFDNTIVDSILFLKEGLTTGQTWSSPVYTGTDSGATKKVRYDFKCDNANATVTLNAQTYSNVYQVTLKVMVDSGSGYQTDITWTNYYAQGIGWIYQKYDDGAGSTYELPIRNYKVY